MASAYFFAACACWPRARACCAALRFAESSTAPGNPTTVLVGSATGVTLGALTTGATRIGSGSGLATGFGAGSTTGFVAAIDTVEFDGRDAVTGGGVVRI